MSDQQLSEQSNSEKPPDYVLAFNRDVHPTFTGIWMGWRWVNGKVVGKAPPVER